MARLLGVAFARATVSSGAQSRCAPGALRCARRRRATRGACRCAATAPRSAADAAGSPSLLTWNVAGLRALLRKQPDALEELVQTNGRPAMVCLQETKLQTTHVDAHRHILPGYTSLWSCSVARKGYSGTAIFVREDVAADIVDVHYGVGEDAVDVEGRLITVELPESYVATCYTPNSGAELRRLDFRCECFESALRKVMRRLAERKPLVLCGDLNVAHQEVDLHDPANNRRSSGFTDEERACFGALLGDGAMVDAFRSRHPHAVDAYTYWNQRTRARDRNRGWRIDYFVLSAAADAAALDCLHLDDVFGSDHCPVKLALRDHSLLRA